jgi:hypothetical protein
MFTVVPGKTGVRAVRDIELAKPAQKPATPAPKPKFAPMHVEAVVHAPCICSCKAAHEEFSRKGKIGNWRNTAKEHRKCQHSHLGRRGRRVVVIYYLSLKPEIVGRNTKP